MGRIDKKKARFNVSSLSTVFLLIFCWGGGGGRPTRISLTHLETLAFPMKDFELCRALMVFEQ